MSNDASPAASAPATTTANVLDVHAGGEHIRVSLPPEPSMLITRLRSLWAHAIREDTAPSTAPITVDLTRKQLSGARRVGTRHVTHDATFTVSSHITTAVIKQLIGTRILLHAGAVVIPGVGTVLTVGPSGAGKSTATVALGAEGTYLTDELTIIDPDTLGVTAFAKPISRITAHDEANRSSELLKRDVAPTELGLTPGTAGPPPSVLLLLEREGSASTPAATASTATPSLSLSLSSEDEGAACSLLGMSDRGATATRTPVLDALHVLSAQSSSTWLVDDGLAALVRILEGCGGALTVRYREANDLASALTTITRTPPQRIDWRHIPGRTVDAPPPGLYAVTSFCDAVAVVEGVAVLRKGALVSTQGLGSLIWDTLELNGPLSHDELLMELVAILGSDPRAPQLLDEAIDYLREENLIAQGA